MIIQAAAADTAILIERKKTLWLCGLSWLFLPAFSCHVAIATNSGFFYWVVPIIWLVLLPILDLALPRYKRSPNNGPGAVLDSKLYDRLLIRLAVPVIYTTLFYCTWTVASSQPSAIDLAGIGLSLGIVMGTLITITRAYAHTESRGEKICSFLATAMIGFGYFRLAHTIANPQVCATPADPSSARMGESLYRFFLRSLRGSIGQAWSRGKYRPVQGGRDRSRARREIVQSLVFAGLLYGTLTGVVGFRVVPVLAVALVSAWFFQMTMVYIQRYGLLRAKCDDGTYEPCSSRHGWNSPYAASALLLFGAIRDSDTHSHLAPRLHSMGIDNTAPKLPFGFATAMIFAALPPLWFRTMDPAVARWADGDLLKVNIDGDAYMSLMAHYHRPGG